MAKGRGGEEEGWVVSRVDYFVCRGSLALAAQSKCPQKSSQQDAAPHPDRCRRNDALACIKARICPPFNHPTRQPLLYLTRARIRRVHRHASSS